MWRTKTLKNGDIHVYPNKDLRKHEPSRECWCDPSLQNEYEDITYLENPNAVVVVHIAEDGRE